MPDPLASQVTPPGTVPVELRFELLGRIGAGNHGVVFRARDSQLQREVAIKRFSHFLADDPRAMRRITREVAALARVSHPNVVTVHDLVHMPDGDGEVTPHLVMELVEGTSLRDLLATRGPSMRSVAAVRGVLEGLAACHQADILHLDIKPANVLVTTRGGVKIVDFGIARAASDTTATVAGTPHYMAPEQFDGRADERSDIYSVGCLLYECVTGAPPFEGTMAAQVMAHRNKPRPDPRALAPQVTPALAAVVMRAMAIDPSARYQSVAEMLSALAAVGAGVDLSVAPDAGPHEVTSVSDAPVAARSGRHALEQAQGVRGRDLAQCLHRGAVAGAGVAQHLVRAAGISAAGHERGQLDGVVGARDRDCRRLPARTPQVVPRRDRWPARGRAPAPTADRPVDAKRAAARGGSGGARLVADALPLVRPPGRRVGNAGDVPWPDDLFGTTWGVAWVLMPAAAVALVLRGMSRLRLRFGSLMMAMIHLAGAGLAAVLFVAYPLAG